MIILALMFAVLLATLIDTSEIETAIALDDMDAFFRRLDAHLCSDCSVNFRDAIRRHDEAVEVLDL